MNFQHLSFALIWCFGLVLLIFIPSHSLSLPLSVKGLFSWIGIIILLFLVLKNVWKAKANEYKEYKEFYFYLKGKIPFIGKELVESKASINLSLSGAICWFLILIFKDGFLSFPLFIVGSILIIWGLSLFLEDNGIYKFTESKLSNKWVLGSLIASLTFWASFKSAGQINNVFGIDPSLFPFTLAAMTVYNIALFVFLLMIPVFLMTLLYMVLKTVYGLITKNHHSELTIFPIIIVFSAYASMTGLLMLDTKNQKKTVKSVAYRTDYNSKHLCDVEWLKGEPVIFVGPNSNYVLGRSESNKELQVIQKCLSL